MNGIQIAAIGGGIAAAVIIFAFLALGESQTEFMPAESQNETFQEKEKFLVYTTFYPLQQFTKAVVGDAATVKSIIPSTGDPHLFKLGPKSVAQLTNADMIIYNGADFEPFIDEIKSNPEFANVIFVDTSIGITLLEGDEHHHHDEHAEDETHEEDEEHEEDLGHAFDPHIWLDPILAQKQVNTISVQLAQADSGNSELYLRNAKTYSEKLDKLDQEIRDELSSCKKDTFVPFHNAFSYFAERYDLHTLAVIQEFSPESPVTAKDIESIIHFAKEHNIKYFFTEENRNPRLSEKLADELGGDILLFSPLESLAEDDPVNTTYFDKMRGNIANLKIALECR